MPPTAAMPPSKKVVVLFIVVVDLIRLQLVNSCCFWDEFNILNRLSPYLLLLPPELWNFTVISPNLTLSLFLSLQSNEKGQLCQLSSRFSMRFSEINLLQYELKMQSPFKPPVVQSTGEVTSFWYTATPSTMPEWLNLVNIYRCHVSLVRYYLCHDDNTFPIMILQRHNYINAEFQLSTALCMCILK